MHQRLYFISKLVPPICESPLTAGKLKTVQVFRPNVSRRTMQSKGRNKAVRKEGNALIRVDHAKRCVLADFCFLFSKIPIYVINWCNDVYMHQFIMYIMRAYIVRAIIVLALLVRKNWNNAYWYANLLIHTRTY